MGGNGALLAVDAATGEDVWRLPGDGPGYGSPIVADLDGVRQIVTLTQKRLVGVDASSGELLWEVPFQVSADTTALTPLVVDGDGAPSRGSSSRCGRCGPSRAVDGWRVEPQWSVDQVWMDFSSPVAVGASVAAFSSTRKGHLVLVDASTGKSTWTSSGRLGESSFLVAAGTTLLSFLVEGDLGIWEVGGGEAVERARYTVRRQCGLVPSLR